MNYYHYFFYENFFGNKDFFYIKKKFEFFALTEYISWYEEVVGVGWIEEKDTEDKGRRDDL